MPSLVGDFPLMSLLVWACSVTIMMTFSYDLACSEIIYDVYKSIHHLVWVPWDHCFIISCDNTCLWNAWWWMDLHRGQCQNMLKCGVIIVTELTHSSTLLKQNSATKLGISTIACHDTLSLVCYQMSCSFLRLINSHKSTFIIMIISSCVVHSWESFVINYSITNYSHFCTCNLYPPETVVI